MIEVKNLVKKYGNHLAVNDVSFKIESGKIYGFLGPNGAGKSTTMNIMTGCLAPSSGTVEINGYDIVKQPQMAKKSIGYLPELPPVYTDMTTYEYLRFVAAAKKVEHSKISEQVAEVMEMTDISRVQNRLIGTLSKGYRQRVGLAQAILGYPEIIVLDEPTVGLDPLQIIEIRNVIKQLGKKHTVFLSSHILSEVNAVCDELIIISHGKIVAQGTPDELTRRMQNNEYKFKAKGDKSRIVSLAEKLANVSSVNVTSLENGEVLYTVSASGDIREQLFYALASEKMPLMYLSDGRMSLEDLFLKLTDEEQAEKTQQAEEEEQEDEEEENTEYKPQFSSEQPDDEGKEDK